MAIVAFAVNAIAPSPHDGNARLQHSCDLMPQLRRVQMEESGGGGRNRTGVHGFAGRCITTLPPRRCLGTTLSAKVNLLALKLKGATAAVGNFPRCVPQNSGAGKEVRTPDLNLGKVALYQLSYSRVTGRRL